MFKCHNIQGNILTKLKINTILNNGLNTSSCKLQIFVGSDMCQQ